MARVSIIMGVYNSESSLEIALESIVSQTFPDWLFIICDDGSTDTSWIILNEYKKKYPQNFFLLRNKSNHGLTYSLNRCMECVTTEYIARMDSDDISLPKRLEEQIDFLDNHQEISFVGCLADQFDENGIWGEISVQKSPVAKDFLWNNPFIHPTIVIRKSALKQVNGYRDVKITKRCEDYDLWFRLYEKKLVGYNLQKVLFQYYEGKNSYPKRKYRYRINEAAIRFQGYRKLKLFPKGLFFVLKPLIVGILPLSFRRFIRN